MTSKTWYEMCNAETGEILLDRVKWCKSYWCRFRGLQLRAPLPANEGLLLEFDSESIMASSIHMFFMRFAIAAVWLNSDFEVVGTALAKPWRPYYAADKPARYVLEAMPALLERVQVGDRLVFE